jgi:hypothetical protein
MVEDRTSNATPCGGTIPGNAIGIIASTLVGFSGSETSSLGDSMPIALPQAQCPRKIPMVMANAPIEVRSSKREIRNPPSPAHKAHTTVARNTETFAICIRRALPAWVVAVRYVPRALSGPQLFQQGIAAVVFPIFCYPRYLMFSIFSIGSLDLCLNCELLKDCEDI